MTRRKLWIRRILASSTGVVLLAIILVALNVVTGFVPLRMDITEEGLFTLSKGSAAIVANLEYPVTIKFYFSKSLPNLPVRVKNYAQKVEELLEEYQASGNGNLTLEFFDPKPDTDEEEWAVKYGIRRVGLSNGSQLMFGMVALSGEREVAIPFIDPSREKVLEYEISQTITRVVQTKKPILGILGFLKISGEPSSVPGQPGTPAWTVFDELSKSYEIQYIFPSHRVIPDDIETLVVIHPKFPPDTLTYAIDQFIMRGGHLVVFTDPNSRMDEEELRKTGVRLTYSNIPKLFAGWGLKFDKTEVIGDQELSTRVNTRTQGVVDFPLWITFRGPYLNSDSVITNQLEEVTLIDAGAFTFEPKEDSDITFTPLLTTSSASGTIDNFMAQMAPPLEVAKNLKVDGKQRVLAAILTGTFDTAFPDGPPVPDNGDGDVDLDQFQLRAELHQSRSIRPTSVLVIGDADFMADPFSVQKVNLFGQTMVKAINDNLNFVLNGIEFISGSQDLISIRSRGTFSRPFTRVLALQRKAQEEYREQENQLSTRLEEVRKRLNELEGGENRVAGQQVILTPEILEEVKRFREEELATRQALREVRRVLRQDIESLGTVLLTINLLAVPLVVAAFGFIGFYRRNKKSGGRV